MTPPKKKQISFAISHKKITKPAKPSFDLDITRNIESEIILNKILDFSFSSETIETFFKKSLLEIGKLKWLCAGAKCSVCLLDTNEKNLLLTAHKNLSGREIKNCGSILLTGKLKTELKKLQIKSSGHLINEIGKHITSDKRKKINRYVMGLKRGNTTTGIIYVQTKDDLTKDESATRFISSFINIAAETILRKENETELAFEKKATDSMVDLSNFYLASVEISIDDISGMVLKKAQDLTKSKFGFVGYIDQNTGRMILPTLTKDVWHKCKVKGKSIVFEKFTGLLDHILKKKKPFISNDLKTNPHSLGVPKGHIPIEKFVMAPAIFNNKLVGMVAIANPEKNYNQADLNYIKRLADFYAITLNRKFEEDKLKYAEDKYRSIINSSNNLIYTINPKGIITFINDNVKKYGFKPQDLVGKHMSNFCHTEDIPLAHAELEKLLKTGKPTEKFVIRFKKQNGTYYYGEQRSGIIHKDGNPESIICSMHDISEERKSEILLKASEEKFRSIVDSSNSLIYTITPQGIVTFINHNIKKYGYTPKEVVGKHMNNFCHPDDLELAIKGLQKILLTGKTSIQFVIRFKKKNGTFFYGEQRTGVIYKDGKPESVICMMYDITQTKELQDKIKKNEELLQTILDTATDIILVKDKNHKFLKVNKACSKFFNMPEKTLIGKTSYDIFSKEMAEKATKEEELVLKQGDSLNLDTVRTTAKGTKIINAIKTPIKNKEGEITGLLAILRDVTEFRKLQEESIHKQVLEEAGKITGQAAHDFNNVLAAINGYSTLVLEELGEKNPVRMEIEAIKKAVGRAVAITTKMQDIPKNKK
jgi:PAS domain S-box-containing protein